MLKQLKLALVAVSLLVGATATGSAQEALQRVLEEKVIKVGVVPGWPRFLMKKPDGDGYEGFARLNFATSGALLDEIIDRMAKVVRIAAEPTGVTPGSDARLRER